MGQHNRVSNVRLVFKSDVFYKNTTKRQAKIHHSIGFPKIACGTRSVRDRSERFGRNPASRTRPCAKPRNTE